MKKRTAFVGAASAAALAVLPLAGTASAVEYTVTTESAPHKGDRCTYANSCAGSASFVHDGDHLLVWDNAADGHSVVVEYERSDENGTDYLRAWNYYGKYHRLDANMNIPEDGWISYRVCLGEYGSRKVLKDTCSAFNWEEAD
ncbi:hypothetical protein D1J63_23100 [Streptomyces sp. KPB2]|uniref:hypothetical protein n=1 Tax=Streptomyces TaxID=1883 RepID=UPI000F6F331A|nr:MULTISPECIES: hypothetical protein [Streptomyces]WSU03455.1 hypothetical protein OG368_23850 [Streptomyces sp. NBC_01124]AZM77503.1 hypothetical protein D1J63_23100 [Streptomyces sp. KPB2]MBH5133541.1 hypothetical protein [Streptomyces sp. HB-N217]MDU0254134.1 hypothetical protein [Streptomyces sp. PU10]QKW63096.1 hypothetical protein HUT15_22675 [Streptomyces sp. NA03103]